MAPALSGAGGRGYDWMGRGLLALALAAALVGLVPPLRPGLVSAVRLLAASDVGALRAWVLSFGGWAPLVSAGLMLLQALLAPLPASPITYVNGLLFGTWWGALLSWASALVAAAVCFGLSRALGRPVMERLVTRAAVEWSDAFFGRFGAWAVLIGRLLPVVSFDVVSYGAGLTSMRFMGFVLATGAGMLPATIVYSYLGHRGGASGQALLATLAVLTLLGVIALALKPAFTRRLVPHDRDGTP